MGCWRGYVSGSKCRFVYGLADATATQLSLAPVNADWFYLPGFTFLVPDKIEEGRKMVGCVCV